MDKADGLAVLAVLLEVGCRIFIFCLFRICFQSFRYEIPLMYKITYILYIIIIIYNG